MLSQRLGMLGRSPVLEVIAHSTAVVDALADLPAGASVIDIGSGGGVPGLVIAWRRRDLDVVLVERRTTRADHLERMVGRLELENARVLATDATRLPQLLAPAAAVVARGFGPPAEVLRMAVPTLAPGGLVVVTEPPAPDPTRWPRAELERYGLARVATTDQRVVVLPRSAPTG